MVRVDDCLDFLKNTNMYTGLDLVSGYWQIKCDEENQPKTAFISPEGHFYFKVIPFGLCNAPATFSRMMDKVLFGLKMKICLVYLDDIQVYSDGFEEHLDRLAQIFQRLQAANLKVKPNKCSFCQTRLLFLGRMVSTNGLEPDPEKVKSIEHMPVPENLTQIRSFLGACTHFGRFIASYSRLAEPLQVLTHKDVEFFWGLPQQIAFDALKQSLINAPILGHFDPEKLHIVETNASFSGIGALLLQKEGEQERVIAYASCTLLKAEKNYSVCELELLAVV